MLSPQNELLETLRRLPLFTDLTESELALLAGRAAIRHFTRGATIFSEGDACTELLIVRDGKVNLLKMSVTGRQQLLSVERGGSSLSDISIFDGLPYPVTAIAAEDTTLVLIDAGHFRSACAQQPELALKVIKALAHRLRRMSSLVEDLSFSTVRARLVAHLLHLAREEGRHGSGGIEFELAENNEQLASRLGTVRELVSRNLGRLHNEGLIQMSRRAVRIPNPNALAEEINAGE